MFLLQTRVNHTPSSTRLLFLIKNEAQLRPRTSSIRRRGMFTSMLDIRIVNVSMARVHRTNSNILKEATCKTEYLIHSNEIQCFGFPTENREVNMVLAMPTALSPLISTHSELRTLL